mmetsp:Transcript_25347/g.38325  ORF Transcript_25347/g.38325 Transcript_25347/m.38325 type:complete len:313 (+) Transcript_25347:47-985(+)|eukprot:scaffold2944_cov155-Skeletonema_dohrnii-CCMP3373.AAC.52
MAAYQSSSTTTGRPPVQESYGGTADSSSNVGLPNSARGEGTTTSEMVAKIRFFNCAVCAYLILFHFLPIVINPIRLALLLKSPVRLVLEAIVGVVAISMLITEAQVPIFAEKVLLLFQKCRVGNVQLIDLDVARGRVVAIVVMTLAMGMVNHLNSHHSNNSNNGIADPTVMDDSQQSEIVNGTNSSAALNETITDIDNATTTSYHPASTYNNDDHNAVMGVLCAIVYSCIFSLSMWILLALLSYTLYVIREYPSYAEYKAFPHVQNDGSASSAARPSLSPASGRSWVSNIPDFSSITGGGYQSVNNPIQMNV